MQARVLPEGRGRVQRIVAIGPGEGIERRRALAHGGVDLQVVVVLVALPPDLRVIVEHHDFRLRQRQRCAHAIGAVFETQGAYHSGDRPEQVVLSIGHQQRIELVFPPRLHFRPR